jgi:diguanylate cyclase (GGDEF)-like protein
LPGFAASRQQLIGAFIALVVAVVLSVAFAMHPARALFFMPYWAMSSFAVFSAWRAAGAAQRPSERTGWWLVVAAMLTGLLAGVVRALSMSSLTEDTGSSKVNLTFVFFAYGFSVLALVRLSNAQRSSLIRVGLDLALVMAGGLTIYAIVLGRTLGADLSPGDFRNPLLYLPFVAAAVAVALLAGLSNGVASPALRRAARWAAAGFGLLSVSHFWLVTTYLLNAVSPTRALVLPFALGYGLLAMAAIGYARDVRHGAAQPQARATESDATPSVWWHVALAILPYSISMIGAGLLLIQVGDSDHDAATRVWSLFGALLIFCIGAARQIIYYSDNRELYARLAASHRGLEQQVREQTAELRRRNRDLEAIHEVALATDRTLDIQRALHGVAEQLGIVAGGDCCRISALSSVRHGARELLAEYHTAAGSHAPPMELVYELPELAAALGQRATFTLTTAGDNISAHTRATLQANHIGAALLVPLHSGERLIGYIEVYRQADDPFTRDDVFVAESIGAHVSLAIANAAAYEQARFAADHDAVTGLLNHRALQERLAAELAHGSETGHPLSVAMIDLNSFKEFNDRFGHQTGDEVLHTIGAAIASGAPAGAYASRYGGDEFTLLMPGYDKDQAGLVIDAIIERVAALNGLRAGGPELSLAAGLATYPQDGSTPSELVERADQLMYRDKWRRKGFIERRRQALHTDALLHVEPVAELADSD